MFFDSQYQRYRYSRAQYSRCNTQFIIIETIRLARKTSSVAVTKDPWGQNLFLATLQYLPRGSPPPMILYSVNIILNWFPIFLLNLIHMLSYSNAIMKVTKLNLVLYGGHEFGKVRCFQCHHIIYNLSSKRRLRRNDILQNELVANIWCLHTAVLQNATCIE